MEPWLLAASRRRPDLPALHTHAGVLSYAELLGRAQAAAAELGALGVGGGSRVAVALPAGEQFAVAVHAALLLGAMVVPIDLRLSEGERVERARDALVIGEPLASGADGERNPPPAQVSIMNPPPLGAGERGLDDPLAVLHTSGTTAAPKPVTLTARNFLAGALGSAVALGLDRDERWLCPMPLVHVGGLSVLIRSAIYATTAVLHERFDTAQVLGELRDPAQALTLVSLVPTMLARLLDAGLEQPPTLRAVLLGGGPIAPALLQRAELAGVPVAPSYGMTEACSQIATDGWPLPGVELRIQPDGEILVRGDTVAPGMIAADGWLHTGDTGASDDTGRIHIIGRKSDTIVSGGENVAPAEVEAVLLEHPDVADAGVHARADEEWGEAVVAVIVARPETRLTAAELQAHCAGRLARFKVPKEFRFARELPRTTSGKLLRRQLTGV